MIDGTKVMRIVRGGSVLLGICAVACGSNDDRFLQGFDRQLQGSWEQVSTVPSPAGGTATLRRTLEFSAGEETLTVEAFVDQALTQRIFTYDSSGPYTLEARSAEIPGGVEALLTNDASHLTLFVDDAQLIATLGFDDCDLATGVRGDVSNGCAAPLFAVSDCVDHDVFLLREDGSFQWGDTGVDRCVEYPRVLDPDVFTRVP